MIVSEIGINYNTLEMEIYRECCAAGCEKLKKTFEQWDASLMLNRDRTVYRHKGQRQTTLKTVMGEVEYKRAVYERVNEDGTKSFVYLLDEAMGISGSGRMSGQLSALIVNAACAGTYRHAAESVSEMTGTAISHQAAWDVVQQLGGRIDEREQAEAERAAENKGAGSLESRVLFEEQDGVYLHLQGRSRENNGKSKEMKVAIAYDGAEKVGEGRFKLTNKVASANFEAAPDFFRRKEGRIAATYNVDEIDLRIVNGDGAGWIRQSVTDETVLFQLDAFHRNKAVFENVSGKEVRKKIFRLLYSKRIDQLLTYIGVVADSVDDEQEKDKLESLLRYFTSNKDGLIGYQRRGIELPKPPDGKEYRRLGAMESNIFTIIGNRMKGGRACWSIGGGNNMARLLALKHTGRLGETLDSLTAWALPQRYAEDVGVALSAAQAPKHDGKGYEPARAGAVPATPKFKFLRELGGTRRISDR